MCGTTIHGTTTLSATASGADRIVSLVNGSKDASAKAWTSSGALSLAEYAGKSIQLRFSFDSVDNYENSHVGWMIDDVVVSQYPRQIGAATPPQG